MKYIDRTAKWMVGGLAVAVALGGLGVVSAGTSGPAPAFTAITPCRLMDTRPGFTVGPRVTPVGENTEVDVQVHGTNGECSIPATATAITANVIAVGPTAASFLSIWPADASNPGTSSLNYLAGQPPTPNTISVALSPAGAITLLNRFGSVDVVIDISGYFADHSHDDRYYTKAQVDSAVASGPGSDAYTKAEVDALAGTKADTSSVYTRSQVDAKDAVKANAADVYTQAEVDAKDAVKANAADVYTQAEVDALAATKANAADVYTQAEVDAKDAVKANAADVYTQAEIEALLPDSSVIETSWTCVGGCAAGSYTTVAASCVGTDESTGGSAIRVVDATGTEEALPSRPAGTPPAAADGWQASNLVDLADGDQVFVFAVCATIES